VKKTILISVMSLLISSEVFAANSKGHYTNYGYKSIDSCGVYVSERRKGLTKESTGWIRGYMSATNYLVRGKVDFFDGVDEHSILLWIENWCMKNPTGYFFGGLMDFLKTRGVRQPR
jgi:hypothetical protein